jgi:hypothetical protein
MSRKLNSFIIRWWRSDAAERLTLEHIQTGQKQVAGSIEDAVAWLNEQQNADANVERPETSELHEEHPDAEETDRSQG